MGTSQATYREKLLKYLEGRLEEIPVEHLERFHGGEVLCIDWQRLADFDSNVADSLLTNPSEFRITMAELLEEKVPAEVSISIDQIRVNNLRKIIPIEEIGTTHVNRLVAVHGVATNLSDINFTPEVAVFECLTCGGRIEVVQRMSREFRNPTECHHCERRSTFDFLTGQSSLFEAQRAEFSPISTNKTTQNSKLSVFLRDELTEELTGNTPAIVTGILHGKLRSNSSRPSLDLELEALHVERLTWSKYGDFVENISIPSPPNSSVPQSYKSFETQVKTVIASHPEGISEEETKAKIVTPAIEALGWNKYDVNEVRIEYSLEDSGSIVDYALFGPEYQTPSIVVEAKRLGRTLRDGRSQLKDYIRIYNASFGVLTNGVDAEIYSVEASVDSNLQNVYEGELYNLSDTDIIHHIKRDKYYPRNRG